MLFPCDVWPVQGGCGHVASAMGRMAEEERIATAPARYGGARPCRDVACAGRAAQMRLTNEERGCHC